MCRKSQISLSIGEFFDLAAQGGVYEVLTPDGWAEIGAIVRKNNKRCYRIRTRSGKSLEASEDHLVETRCGWMGLGEISVETDQVLTVDGYDDIVALELLGEHDTLDMEVKHPNQRYWSNGISFDLSTMNNRDFTESWAETVSQAPCIALFEDIDGVFDGRKNVVCDGGLERGLSFDCLLNVIDGVDNSDGVFKIVTTNNLDRVDPALGNPVNGSGMSSRPGRIDRVIEFPPLDEAGRVKMARRIFEGFKEEGWRHLLAEGGKDTGAQFQERCCRLAMQMFWEEAAAAVSDECVAGDHQSVPQATQPGQ